MEPWPALAPHGRSVLLPCSRLRLFCYDLGPPAAPALLLLHGLGDEADTWRHVAAPLAASYRVIAPDLPGFGRSDQPARPYGPAFLRDTVVELMDALDIGEATLVGSSLGAMLAQLVALTRPGRARRLVLIGGTLLNREQQLGPAAWFLVPGLGERLYTGLRRDPQAAYATLRPFYADLDGLPAADRDFLYRRVNQRVWSDGQRRAYLSALRHLVFWLARSRAEITRRMAALATPTRYIWGERDVIMPMACAHASVAVQPAASLAVVPGAGHLPHQEQPAAFLATLAG
jgi:pimeloyl-ACP methyl ester carboxylesterase